MQGHLVRWSVAFAAAGVGLSVLDAAVVAHAGAAALLPLVAHATLTAVAAAWLALPLGGVAALVALPAEALTRWGGADKPARGAIAAGALAGGVVALAVFVLLKPWEIGDYRAARVAVPALVVGGALLGVGALRSPRALGVVAPLLGALACFLADAFVLRRLYFPLHHALALLAWTLAAVALHRVALGADRTALLVLALHAGLWLPVDARAVRRQAHLHAAFQPKLIATLHAVTDFDGDGHSRFLGGGDCAGDDPTRHPGACELPGDGRDQNCNGLVDGALPAATPGPALLPAAPPAPFDVYFVLLDTLRADFGRAPRAEVAPELERLAARSLDFGAAVTPYPSTWRAMLCLVHGRYLRSLHASGRDLTAVLGAAGYDAELWVAGARHALASGRPVLAARPTRLDPFSRPDWKHKAGWSAAQVDQALEELGRDAAAATPAPRRFRWLHWMDPHAPYLRGGSGVEGYRLEIAHASRQVGRLVAGLEATPRGRRAVVIVTADHGDEHADHGGLFHGATLYQENVRVPLIVHVPGVAPARIEHPVSLIDVLPTLAELLAQPPDPAWQGQSLLRPSPDRAVFSQVEAVADAGGQGRPSLQGVWTREGTLIENLDGNLTELYLPDDPAERADAALSHPERVAPLRARLAEWQDQDGCAPVPGAPAAHAH